MRPLTAAAIQIGPARGSLTPQVVDANINRSLDMIRRCVAATGADLVVLPESVTTGFTPDCSVEMLWDLVSELPGTMTEPFQELARELRIVLCFGTYERGAERGTVHNASVLINTNGEVLGVYRKTHPFTSESVAGGGWVTPGDTVTVCDTALGRIGMIICFDGDYPELSRIQAVQGAEIICRPSALLRSADIWELTSRARAYDNHVFVIGANATGIDPAGVIYFGNSHIVTPNATVLAKAASHEGWVSARLDPETALSSLTPGSNIRQGFDHLRDRNLDLIRRHREDLESPAKTSFPHGRPRPDHKPEGD
ncbi:apolipoprotein N- acyltransferase [Knoellia sinensis KCTC 19936]|uniref:Apolipoprotein N-acyltransferase n=1 Tax=Knoellia sinensis KCTC 19936 TaxID=1385520 RepID=A0A0A0J6F0_9MICO|nr:carbon-nitrogen hydrolase family protein [Knoellia sinensis]KGN32920.1 apolipoprotein N- acyltransferase [Knoellia sinensis KCTC 19936]